MNEPDPLAISADDIVEPLVFCVMSGGDNGWFHVDVRTSARDTEGARKIAEEFLTGIFAGRHKVIREEPNANEQTLYDRKVRVVRGYCRFSFRLADGPIEHLQHEFESGVRYISWGR